MKLPQLSVRDLFWLVLVCACLCSWWVERQKLNNDIATLQAELLREKAWQADVSTLINGTPGRFPDTSRLVVINEGCPPVVTSARDTSFEEKGKP